MPFCRCQDLLNRSSMICISRLWISSLCSSILSKCSFRSTPCCWIIGITLSFRWMPWLESSASVIWRMSCSSHRSSLLAVWRWGLLWLQLPLQGNRQHVCQWGYPQALCFCSWPSQYIRDLLLTCELAFGRWFGGVYVFFDACDRFIPDLQTSALNGFFAQSINN